LEIARLTSTYTVCKNDVANSGNFLHSRFVVINQYSGKIMDVDDPAIGTSGEVFTLWQLPLHAGIAFGWMERIPGIPKRPGMPCDSFDRGDLLAAKTSS
jgi:uncharacterized iron-regulated membrane protein